MVRMSVMPTDRENASKKYATSYRTLSLSPPSSDQSRKLLPDVATTIHSRPRR
ncbi:hypothetical protein RGF97_06765 [Streptomyces roseicoloratus]|uniref:Uncharacterized protein n=1 Tax=Streptomyces roseicoloratus TaxID=2508722 RepID=A0ABY9RSE9_9ACTN|nr:hypothetical protein [Streptomyces roseicoloratus]WMX44623.1 hypothetical protein RGF97_06765 [Streptomyces roseicoloratus]